MGREWWACSGHLWEVERMEQKAAKTAGTA